MELSPDSTIKNSTYSMILNLTCTDNVYAYNMSIYIDGVQAAINTTPVNGEPWHYNYSVIGYGNHLSLIHI